MNDADSRPGFGSLPESADARQNLHGSGGCFHALVVGCGPSTAMYCAAQLLDWSIRNRARIYCCNDSWLIHNHALPADHLIVLDDGFVWDHRTQIRAYLATHPRCRLHTCFDPGHPHERIRLDRNRKSGPNTPYMPGIVFDSGSSGIAAIQIAMHHGASKISLIGHDLVPHDGKSRSSGRGGKADSYPQGLTMECGYATIAAHAHEIGIDIVNLSPISALNCFPRIAGFSGG